MQELWNKVKTKAKQSLPPPSYRMWIDPLALKSWTNGTLVLTAPNFFSRKRVTEHYGQLLERIASEVAGSSCRIQIEIDSAPVNGEALPLARQLPLPEAGPRFHNGRLLRRDFTFDQFVVGGNNDFAYSAALSLAAGRRNGQNALFLISRPGMGKSHLAQAVGHHILTQSRAEQVFYTTAEDFANEMIRAFQTDRVPQFKEKYRNGCDVLLLEDVHYLSGKERTQIELAQTLDSFQENGKKIIFSSCCLPSEIPRLNDKLCSRLSNGLISKIDPPNFRTRVRILQKKAAVRGHQLPEDVIHFLASELQDDVRQLESGLVGVTAKSSLLGVPIDMSLAESVVATIIRTRKSITIEGIKQLVCRQYRVSKADVVSRSRKKCFVRPRQVAIYLARRYTDAPLETIGRSFNRYHATVMHSIKLVEQEMKADAALRRQVELISERLEAGDF
ncbi:MAG: chromosomal replication initiator protein DnaA [Deltaproteobacteria bacterium]|nr:chromosomal replication initiator protein DnaA [Deltaproteobacteria bacterium]RLB93266.1 MAG: chromosomal replication initiator protein DnaA [Deltaproteobacteria bacterium]